MFNDHLTLTFDLDDKIDHELSILVLRAIYLWSFEILAFEM